MTTRIVTCCWGHKYKSLGERWAESFAKFWPANIEIVMYVDRDLSVPRRVEKRLLSSIPGLDEFYNRWRDVPEANGLGSKEGLLPKDQDVPRSWKRDACKWVAQAMTPRAAIADMKDGDILAWFDADVVTTESVPEGWIDKLLNRKDMAFLARKDVSEIGFIGFRLPQSKPIMEAFSGIYESGQFIELRMSHSAYIFDRARERFPNVTFNDLSSGQVGHVWPSSPLAKYTRHDKGKRKPIR